MGTRFLSRITAALFALLLPAPAFADLQWTDIACETSSTTGTGTLTLDGALSGYLGFAAAGITSGNTVPYQIRSSGHIETGIGTFTDAVSDTLARTTVKYSTDGAGTALTLSADSVVCIGPIASLWAPDFIIPSFSAGATGPTLTLNHDSASPAALDAVGTITVQGEDSAGNDQTYSSVRTEIADPTSTSEDSRIEFDVQVAGAAETALDVDGTGGNPNVNVHVNNHQYAGLNLDSTYTGAEGPSLSFSHLSPSPAAGDYTGRMDNFANDNLGNYFSSHYFEFYLDDVTNGSEDASWRFYGAYAGTEYTQFAVIGGAEDIFTVDGINALTLGGAGIAGVWAVNGSHSFNFGSVDYPGLTLQNSSAGAGGPWLVSFQDSASPALNDQIAGWDVRGRDSLANAQPYGFIDWRIVDPTSGSEDSKVLFGVYSGGSSRTALTLDSSGATVNADAFTGFYAIATSNAGFGPTLTLEQVSTSPAADDAPGWVQFFGRDSLGVDTEQYGLIAAYITDPTNGSEDSRLVFDILSAGAVVNPLTLGTSIAQGGGTTSSVFNVGSVFAGVEVQNANAGTGGPIFSTFHDSATPAATDVVGQLQAWGRDSAANVEGYGGIDWVIVDTTSTSEDSKAEVYIRSAGTDLAAMTLGTTDFTGTPDSHVFDHGSADGPNFTIQNSTAGVGGPFLNLRQGSASPAANDIPGTIEFVGNDSLANVYNPYGRIQSVILDPTSTSEDSKLTLDVMSAGSEITALKLGQSSLDGAAGGPTLAHQFGFPASADYPGTVLYTTNATANGGPYYFSFQDSATPAASDFVGGWNAFGRDSLNNIQLYAGIDAAITDPTSGSEDSTLSLNVQAGGANLTALTLTATTSVLNLGSADFSELYISSTSAGAGGPGLTIRQSSASPAASDGVGFINFNGLDSGAGELQYANLTTTILDPTNGSEDAKLAFYVVTGGSLATAALTLGTTEPTGSYTGGVYSEFAAGSADFGGVIASNTAAAAGGPLFIFYQNSASPAANDVTGQILWVGKTSTAAVFEYSAITSSISDATNGSTDSHLEFFVSNAGTEFSFLNLGTTTTARSAFGSQFVGGANDEGGSVELTNTFAGASGPNLTFYMNSASPAASDNPGAIYAYGKDSLGNVQFYNSIIPKILDATSASEDSQTLFEVLSAGSTITALTLGGTDVGGSFSHVLDVGSQFGTLQLQSSSAAGTGPFLIVYHNSASPAANDEVGGIATDGRDSAANIQGYGQISWIIDDTTSTSEDSHANLTWQRAGTNLSFSLNGGIAKVWGNTTGGATPSLASPSYNMTSITDTAVGRLTVTIATDFDTATYTCAFGATTTNSTTASRILAINTKAAGSFEIDAYSAVTPTLADVIVGFDWACFGS